MIVDIPAEFLYDMKMLLTSVVCVITHSVLVTLALSCSVLEVLEVNIHLPSSPHSKM